MYYQNYPQYPQYPNYNQRPSISGRFVNSQEEIAANEVSMDGTASVFPNRNLTEIYVKTWNNDGTIRTTIFKPFYDPDRKEVDPSKDLANKMMSRFDKLEKMLQRKEST